MGGAELLVVVDGVADVVVGDDDGEEVVGAGAEVVGAVVGGTTPTGCGNCRTGLPLSAASIVCCQILAGT